MFDLLYFAVAWVMFGVLSFSLLFSCLIHCFVSLVSSFLSSNSTVKLCCKYFLAVSSLSVPGIFVSPARPEYNFFKPRQTVRKEQYYIGHGKFHTKHQTKLFLKKVTTSRVFVALKTIWTYCNLIDIKLGKHMFISIQ